MAGVFVPPGEQTFPDTTGKPNALGTVAHYVPNTLTPKFTYADEAQTVVNPTIISLDAAGRCSIWGTGLYRQILKDQFGVQVWDRITGFAGGGSSGTVDFVNVQDFGVPDGNGVYPASAFTSALATVAPGGTLYFPTGRYSSPDVVQRSAVTYRGEKMPTYNAGNTALENGAVIEGELVLSGDSLTVTDLGVDSGSVVCAKVGSSGMNALVVHDSALSLIRTQIVVQNVIGLCKNPSVMFHGVLLEGLDGLTANNVRGRYGFYPVVIKATRSQASQLYGYSAGDVGIFIKSDSYAPCTDVTLDGMFYDDDGSPAAATAGVMFYAATSSMERITASNINTIGATSGVKLVGAPRSSWPVNAMSYVMVDNVASANAVTYGVETFGALGNCALRGMTIENPISNKALHVQEDAFVVVVSDVSATVLSADAATMYLGGDFTADNIQSVVTLDRGNPSGITIVPGADGLFELGEYIGTLSINTGTGGLLNGWTTAFVGSEPSAKYRNGRVYLAGRIAPPVTRTGKEIAYLCGIGPAKESNFGAIAYNASTHATLPVYLRITVGGQLSFDLLNDTGNFPAAVSYVMLDGLSFPVGEV